MSEPAVRLRDVRDADVPVFFEHQLDPVANDMAAFTPDDPHDRASFTARWTAIRSDPAIVNQTIVADGEVAGYIASFIQNGRREVGYWIGREYWGRGIASAALAAFVRLLPAQRLYARVVKDNAASLRVLEKSGFRICGDDTGYANARAALVEEFVLVRNEEDVTTKEAPDVVG
jgi:RimJ/RimL family protein N-acetyltransferase